MSWDILVQDIPSDINTIKDLHQKYEYFQPKQIGTRSEIISKIKQIVPEADFDNPSWGLIEGQDFSIEVNMGENEECVGFAFHVRGGDDAAFLISDILKHLNLRAFDPTSDTGLFKIGIEASEGLKRWHTYRNKIFGKE